MKLGPAQQSSSSFANIFEKRQKRHTLTIHRQVSSTQFFSTGCIRFRIRRQQRAHINSQLLHAQVTQQIVSKFGCLNVGGWGETLNTRSNAKCNTMVFGNLFCFSINSSRIVGKKNKRDGITVWFLQNTSVVMKD